MDANRPYLTIRRRPNKLCCIFHTFWCLRIYVFFITLISLSINVVCKEFSFQFHECKLFRFSYYLRDGTSIRLIFSHRGNEVIHSFLVHSIH